MNTVHGCIAAFAAGFLFVVVNRAPALECEDVKDHDRREMCRALTSGDASHCELIGNASLRAECRARVKSER